MGLAEDTLATEVYNLRTLEGKDDLGTFMEILFAD